MAVLSRVVAVLAIVASVATAHYTDSTNHTIYNLCTDYVQCVTKYSTEVQSLEFRARVRVQGQRALCPLVETLFSCIVEKMNACFTLYNYNISSYVSETYRKIFIEIGCTSSVTIRGLSRLLSAFGDPHYRLLNGKIETCNAPGWHVLAATKLWTVRVHHTPVHDAAVIDTVDLMMQHPVAPTERLVWNLTAFPSGKFNELTVTPTGQALLKALDFIMSVKKVPSGDALSVSLGVHDQSITGGLLYTGCPEETQPLAPTNATMPQKCKVLPEANRAACAYDAKRMGESWAVAAAEQAEDTEKEVNVQLSGATAVLSAGLAVAAVVLALL